MVSPLVTDSNLATFLRNPNRAGLVGFCEGECDMVRVSSERVVYKHHRFLVRIRKKLQEAGYPNQWAYHALAWKHPSENANVVVSDFQDEYDYFTVIVSFLDDRKSLRNLIYQLKAETSHELIDRLKKHRLISQLI